MDIKGSRLSCLLLAMAGANALTIMDVDAQTIAQSEFVAQPLFIKVLTPPAVAKPAAASPAEVAAREKLLADAEALMKEGKPAAAYALLEPLEFEQSGEVRFDYLIGIAALDSGKPDKATIAFERVLAVDPNFAGARLDMARAYYQLGDTPRAKTEFEAVLAQNPPQAAKAVIQKYLAAIAAQENVRLTHYSGYVEGMAGHDNNVNNSTSQSQIAVPAFGNLLFTLSPTNLKTADDYIGLAAGVAVDRSVNAHVALYAAADIHQRGNMTKTNFDYYSLDGRAGVSLTQGAELFRAGVLASQYVLASARNRDTTGINAEWRHTANPANQLSVSAQFSRNRFADAALQTNDFDQYTLGAGWLHVLADAKSVVFGSVFHGSENDVASVSASNPSGGRADGNKRLTGLRVGGQMPLGERWDAFASLGAQTGKYDKTNASFLSMREDRLDDISIGANWQWKKQWTVRPQLAWSRNDSNIAIYSFSRVDASVTVRRDFK